MEYLMFEINHLTITSFLVQVVSVLWFIALVTVPSVVGDIILAPDVLM